MLFWFFWLWSLWFLAFLKQGHKEWLAEVQFLGVVNHPNLVKLLGYCSVDGERGIQRLLVYEYMANRSLEDHLFNRALPTMPWMTRLQVMLGSAEGLAYLHQGLEVQVHIVSIHFIWFDHTIVSQLVFNLKLPHHLKIWLLYASLLVLAMLI